MAEKKVILRWFLFPWIVFLVVISLVIVMNRKPPYRLSKYPDLRNVEVKELIILDQKRGLSEGVLYKENLPEYIKGENGIGVLLIHGFTASPFEMAELASFLNSKGFSVYNVRIVGHGSKSEYLDKLSYKDWYESIKYGYFTLKNSCKEVFVVGQSMGGLLAINIANYNSVDGLILLAPALKIVDEKFNLVPFAQFFIDSIEKEYSDTSKFKNFYYDRRSVKGMVNLKYLIDYTWKNSTNLSVPMLLIHSKFDDVVKFSGSQEFYNLYKGEKKFVVIDDPGVKHILSSSINPNKDYVHDEILKWLEVQRAKK
ncbi:MAG: alpha/beta fold hydrolase [Calditerrivibrio sp.]|nr:alpha/beta fold hydrolase [Calditerrivibrio sp.]MCA1932654.1 alpha/beta fold hydrolase [Calditerrivibrio sp.]MCA1980272.1 alpha/beta fold hydrolase [Calditerrivibrio sp.]